MSDEPASEGATGGQPQPDLAPLIDETARLNNRFQRANDQATRDLGLSTARCQVLDQVEVLPLSVAQIARRIGLARQSVQRTADLLEAGGMVTYLENPDHLRAKLVALTENGRLALAVARRAQQEWQQQLSESVDESEVDAAVAVLRSMRERLDQIDRELRSQRQG